MLGKNMLVDDPDTWKAVVPASQPLNIMTGNGVTKVTKEVQTQSRALDEQLTPMLLDSAPAALGTGYRCMEKGYGFYWPPYSLPFMVTPHGVVLPHEVEDYLPYLSEPDNFSVAISQKPPLGLPGVPARACPRCGNVRG